MYSLALTSIATIQDRSQVMYQPLKGIDMNELAKTKDLVLCIG